MVIIILAWISIFFIFFSFGDCFISLFNRITRRNEQYNVTDTFILGMCFTLIPLSITSLWLPSNHYMMFTYIGLGVVYWIVSRKRLMNLLLGLKNEYFDFSKLQRFALLMPFACFFVFSLYQHNVSDASFYHHQLTNWNESYKAVFGIANIESRMGFNSNYSLLSAIFTFRFLTGDQHFLLQSLLAALITCTLVKQVFRSNYNTINTLALLLFFILCFYNSSFLTNSSTDIVSALCVFYIAMRLVLYPYLLKKNYLLLFFIPISLITFKFSTLPFALLSFYILLLLCKERDFRSLYVCLFVGGVVVVLWCIRNVIISGYLVYPIYQVDLFSFDWKVPSYVAKVESWWIKEYPKRALFLDYLFMRYSISDGEIFYFKARFLAVSGAFLLTLFSCLSPIIVGYAYLKRVKVHMFLYILFTFLAVYISYGLIIAPDFRFIAGAVCVMILLQLVFIFKIFKKQNYKLTDVWKYLYVLPLILLFLIAVKSVYNGYIQVWNIGCDKQRPYYTILYAPYTSKSRAMNLEFNAYLINNGINVYMVKNDPFFSYDVLPATCITRENQKWQPITTVESRGYKLEDGFRPKSILR